MEISQEIHHWSKVPAGVLPTLQGYNHERSRMVEQKGV